MVTSLKVSLKAFEESFRRFQNVTNGIKKFEEKMLMTKS